MSKRKVLSNSVFITISALLVQGTGFLLLPFYTNNLSTSEYGTINLITSFVSVLGVLMSLSLVDSLIRYYVDFKDNKRELEKFYGSILTFILLIGAFFVLVLLLFESSIRDLFLIGVDSYFIYVSIVLLVFFNCVQVVHNGIIQGMQLGKKVAVVNLVLMLSIVFLRVLFIGVFNLSIYGYVLAQLIINFIYFFYVIFDLRRNQMFILILKRKYLKLALLYSVPLIPHSLSSRLASLLSRLFISNSESVSTTGIYSLSLQITGLIDVVQVSFHKAFKPWFFEIMNSNEHSKKSDLLDMTKFLLYIYSIVYLCIALFSQEVIILMTSEDYWSAWYVVPILTIGFSIKSIYYFYVNIIVYNPSASNKLFIASVVSNLIDITLSFILISYIGVFGAAISFVLSKIVLVIITVSIANKYKEVDYKVIGMVKIIVPSLILSFLGLYFSYFYVPLEFNIYNFAYKIVIVGLYLIVIGIINRKRLAVYVGIIKDKINERGYYGSKS